MPKNKSVYPRGQLAKTVQKIISKYVGGIYVVDEIIKQVKMILPNALDHSIKGLITYEYEKRRWAIKTKNPKEYKLTDAFGKSIKRKKEVIIKSSEDQLTFIEIGRGISAYINELKTLADIAEEENVKLTKQVNKLQDAFNELKIGGSGVNVSDIMK